MKHSILIFSVILITSSCTKKNDEKSVQQTPIDTVKKTKTMQELISERILADTAWNATPYASENTASSPLVGSWDDVDPADPGPGSQGLNFETNGECSVSQQEGGYTGTWSYDPATGILNLKLSHTNGSGEIDREVNNDYKIEELTESRISISDLTEEYPQLGGFFWKSNAQ
jgi:hypothetical protein